MVATVTSIAPTREGDAADPLRAALGSALAAKAKAEGALASHRAALAKADELVIEAQAKLAAAVDTVATAKRRHADQIAASVSGGRQASTGAVRAARAAETDAADDVEAAEAAVATLRERLPEFQEDIRRAEIGVIAARNAVLAEIAAPLVERLAVARRDWFGIQQTLRVLVADERYPELANSTEYIKRTDAAHAPLTAHKQALDRLLTETVHRGGPAVAAWETFRAALLKNPDAEAPQQ